MAFKNQIMAARALLRDAIESTNYLSGVRGWSIRKDGTAELNDAILRGSLVITNTANAILVYEGTPALGNLRLAIASTNGSDAYGNFWAHGLTVINNTTGAPDSTPITFKANSGLFGELGILDFNESAGPGINALIELVASAASTDVRIGANGELALYGDPITLNSGHDMLFGSGVAGKYFFEQYAPDAQVIASAAAFTTLVNLTVTKSLRGYASGMVLGTGIWTCPVSGIWRLELSAPYVLGGSGRCFAGIFRNGAANANIVAKVDTTTAATDMPADVARTMWLDAGDTIRFRVGQVSGAAQTLDTRGIITIKREL